MKTPPIIDYAQAGTPDDIAQEASVGGIFIANMPNADYHAYPYGVSKSGLDLIDRSPAHYYHSVPREASRAMEIGTAIHTALLEPHRFASTYVLLRNVKDRRASEYKEAVKVHGSERVLVSHEADKVVATQETVLSQIGDLLTAGHCEISAFVADPETGVIVRCRYDLLYFDDSRAIDIKKTQDARAREFARSVANYRYYVQDALYSDVYYWITGERLGFEFAAVEEQPPHTACRYTLDDEWREYGRICYRRNLDTFARCEDSGDWPHYQPETGVLSAPGWMATDIDEEIVEGVV